MQEYHQFRSTGRTAAYAVAYAVVIILALYGLKHLLRNEPHATTNIVDSVAVTEFPPALELHAVQGGPLVPILDLTVVDASMETNWSAALAALLDGQTEAPVESGRVDVLTRDYAIEVDRLDKWHEGIGQAAHYGLLTKAMPVVALMVPSDNWPLSESTRAKLLLIEKTCCAQNVKLILLRRVNH